MDALPPPIRLGPLIRVSPYFDYYFVAGRPDRFCKVPTRRRTKRYLGVPVRFPTVLYTTFKFGVTDVIEYERRAFESLRPHLDEYLPREVQRARTESGQPALCGEWPANYDGAQAEIACLHGAIQNAPFWDHVDRIVRTVYDRRLALLGVFSSESASVLVHKVSAEEWKPVIIDALKFGRRFYYYQFWIHWPAQFRRKFDRGLAEFERMHRTNGRAGKPADSNRGSRQDPAELLP